MTTNNAIFFEGQSVIRTPIFNGSNYVSWKERMIIFLQSIDVSNYIALFFDEILVIFSQLWDIIGWNKVICGKNVEW